MTTVRLEKQGNYIIDEGTDINFDSHQEDGAAWNPTLPDEHIEGSFDTTISILNTQNYVWNYITWVWEYWSGLTDPDTSILIQLLGITPDYEESTPLAEISITPTYPFSIVDETRTINLEDSISGSNLVLKDSLAGAGVVQVDLPTRWSNYIDATLERVWLEGWTHRYPLPVTGSTRGIVNSKPLLHTVTYAAEMNTDFSDIRFTDSDGVTELDYELVSKTDGVSATFWFQSIEFEASPTIEQIYVYYGNTGAVSEADPENVWDYYDTFEDGLYTGREYPFNDWYLRNGTGGIETTAPITGDNSIYHTGDGNDSIINRFQTTTAGDVPNIVSFDFTLKAQGATTFTPYLFFWFIQYTDLNNYTVIDTIWDSGTSKQVLRLRRVTSGSSTNIATSNWLSSKLATGTVYHFDIIYTGTGVVIRIDGTIQISVSFPYTLPIGYYGFGANKDTSGIWDNIKIHTPPNSIYGYPTIGSALPVETSITINNETVSDETQQYITFNTPTDWTTKEPAYLTLKTITNDDIQTHETMIQPTDTIQMTPHSPTPYYALRLRFTVNSTDELGFNVHDIMGSYEYLENIE
jgi:hypothetical protein